MLSSVTLHNFKGHTLTTVPLQQLTVLVGPNGSGKTSVLQALACLGRLAAGKSTEEAFSGDLVLPGLPRNLVDTTLALSAAGQHESEPYALGFEYQHVADPMQIAAGRRPGVSMSWSAAGQTLRWDSGEKLAEQLGKLSSKQLFEVVRGARESLGSAALFSFDPAIIASVASSSDPLPRIEFDGRNTAVALKAMKLGYDEQWDRLRKILRNIVPSVVSLGVEQVREGGAFLRPSPSQHTAPPPSGEWYRLFFDFKSAKHVPAHHASEGTLLAVALLAVLLGPAAPKLILLDDIEQTLHPTAQMELMRQLKALLALDEMRNVQVIATTHSPYIIEQLDPKQVQVFALRADGSVATRCLADHPDARELRGAENAADLWTNDPESSWVVGPEAP